MSVNWHYQFQMQAFWTDDLREYLFAKARVETAKNVLEVGCGTGAVLSRTQTTASLHGLDTDLTRLREARTHTSRTHLLCADSLYLPYPSQTFDIVFCHYFLLWVADPIRALREMRRVTHSGGYVLVMAEPDYSQRVDSPEEWIEYGKLQNKSLELQGANPYIGSQLATLFQKSDISLIEFGPLQRSNRLVWTSMDDDLALMEYDLSFVTTPDVIKKYRGMELRAALVGGHSTQVPTYFAWGQVK